MEAYSPYRFKEMPQAQVIPSGGGQRLSAAASTVIIIVAGHQDLRRKVRKRHPPESLRIGCVPPPSTAAARYLMNDDLIRQMRDCACAGQRWCQVSTKKRCHNNINNG
ncbi:hypothetical protein E2C01_065920 [Portunus trituberculatus]|uniref:Uncharacterized protein n=1 Tax=Portunus trituberculatus TaxID=210409 RepID=A0A5B7HNW5_PORTR|nr:hypothetical protein [Portunus trituberculatus]